ncbi:glycosyltransferase [Shouchella hunanensis]|uniref:cellulose synthase (UDP-forming) n=1 Tax=Shouchella hunanensis TaxID=766894 RepID=A0ABY7VZE7_9BACI|nr:glycosyltransferase [Shouchella hunanensis]WDF02077.1 glycosyltransferase [Shouchella hunanensis]
MNDPSLYWLIGSTVLLLCLFFCAKKWAWARYALLIAFIAVTLLYLLWRSFFTLPTIGLVSLIFGILLLLAEWAGFLQSIVFTILSWRPFKRKAIPISVFDELPTVDVFIATYNEPEDLLKRTITASLQMRYPKEKLNVYVCDDGRRKSVQALVESIGNATYISRPTNEHQKAGNLNHALTLTSGEFIVTMDADMVPRASFLEQTLGHFIDPKVSFVQAPQVFYNADPFQYNLFFEDRITNEQDFFMRRLEEGKDRFNATMYVGSNALFRRTSLENIGGFATGVITEDMATGMLLQTNGQKSVFVNETLAVGLSPETYADLLKQRDRWCRGNIQVMRKWNPFTIKGLSFMQRLLYADGIHYWFFGMYKMIYLLAPILFLLFSIYSLQTDLSTLLLFWLPSFVASQLAFRIISGNKRSVLWSHVYEVALAPYMALSVLSEVFLKKEVRFNVTRKGVLQHKRHLLWLTSMPYLLLLGLSLTSIVLVGVHFLTPMTIFANSDMLYINLFWILYNLVALVMALLVSIERPRFRGAERFNVDINGMLTSDKREIECKIIDLSETGARLMVMNREDASWLSLDGEWTLSTNHLSQVPVTKEWINTKRTVAYVGISFDAISQHHYEALIAELFAHGKDIYSEREYNNASLLYAMLGFLKKTEQSPRQQERQSIRQAVSVPIMLQADDEIAATITDLSLSGCRVKMSDGNVPILPDQVIEIVGEDERIVSKKARVQWIQKRGRKLEAGLFFLPKQGG